MSARRKVTRGRAALWLAALVPPLAWLGQGTLGWYLAGHACPREGAAISLGGARGAIIALTIGGLIASLTALLSLSRGAWARLGPGEERKPATAIERRRFVATAAVVASATLALGLVLAGLPALVINACGDAR